jgi:hypothetical protein
MKSLKAVKEEAFFMGALAPPLRKARRLVWRVKQDTPRVLGCQ